MTLVELAEAAGVTSKDITIAERAFASANDREIFVTWYAVCCVMKGRGLVCDECGKEHLTIVLDCDAYHTVWERTKLAETASPMVRKDRDSGEEQ